MMKFLIACLCLALVVQAIPNPEVMKKWMGYINTLKDPAAKMETKYKILGGMPSDKKLKNMANWFHQLGLNDAINYCLKSDDEVLRKKAAAAVMDICKRVPETRPMFANKEILEPIFGTLKDGTYQRVHGIMMEALASICTNNRFCPNKLTLVKDWWSVVEYLMRHGNPYMRYEASLFLWAIVEGNESQGLVQEILSKLWGFLQPSPNSANPVDFATISLVTLVKNSKMVHLLDVQQRELEKLKKMVAKG